MVGGPEGYLVDKVVDVNSNEQHLTLVDLIWMKVGGIMRVNDTLYGWGCI